MVNGDVVMKYNYDSIIEKMDKIYNILCKTQHNKHYRYYNANPANIITDDCVIRAISTALDKSWDDVLKDLFKYSLKYKYFINCQELYEIYLQNNKWQKHKKPYRKNGKEYSLNEWLEIFGGEAIVTVGEDHLTYVNKHVVYDVWDCTNGIVETFWTKKK